ncbi:hypothetical protein QYH69_32510 [Paraburkholderia sp. SARCC-3016]|uniref:rolling circle replication-associated protein n=1 Tax=Paraburkholderia sp. SARCC-3016 TaxID=3058611 RepID=UPI0028090C28|nr:hypothetical protein [Paraburkholderia sp. SARCC-3016]MDQ7981948.1 hypothetical protein [Paraburkholderia sp. SARCC-3016]
MSSDIVGGNRRTFQDVLNEYGSPQALNVACVRGEAIPDCDDAGFPFSDEYIVRTKRFVDGQQEVVAFSTRVLRHFNEIRLRPRGVRGRRVSQEGESDADVSVRSDKSLRTSIERSKRMIRQRCKAIGADRMLTFSTRSNESSIEVWAKWWDAFRRRMNRLKDFHYVAVLERQERGAWHIHVAVSGRQDWKLLRSIWLSVLRDSNTDGTTYDSIKDFEKYLVRRQLSGKGRAMRHLIATYIAKYVGKSAGATAFNKKRYWTSKGIVLPEVVPYAHLGSECDRGDAIQAAYDCVGANGAHFDSAQLFWNRGIGVFWMATGNTVSSSEST